jgi:hypothetical protein
MFTTYYCSECNTQLALKDEDTGSGWVYSECKHFCWVNVSKTCYYDTHEERCEPEIIKQLKEKSIVKIDKVDNIFLLIPRGEQ